MERSKNNPCPTNFQIIQEVKNTPQNWRIDEVITEYNHLSQAEKKRISPHS